MIISTSAQIMLQLLSITLIIVSSFGLLLSLSLTMNICIYIYILYKCTHWQGGSSIRPKENAAVYFYWADGPAMGAFV